MEYDYELDIVILVAIRNNDHVPYYKSHKLFEYTWHTYCYRFFELSNEGLFKIYCVNETEALYIYQLTPKGKFRLGELLTERDHEIKMKCLKTLNGRQTQTKSRFQISQIKSQPIL